MSYPLKKEYHGNYNQANNLQLVAQPIKHPSIKLKTKKKKTSGFTKFVKISFLSALCYFTIQSNYQDFIGPNFVYRFKNKNLNYDVTKLIEPTSKYLSNANILGQNVIANHKGKKEILQIVSSGEIQNLAQKIDSIANKYKGLTPHVYAYDFSTGETLNYNGEEEVPVASMIKIPILFEYFKQVEEGNKDLSPNRKIIFEDYHKTSGSGHLQYQGTGGVYSMDYMLDVMITQSDNSATNLILDYIGGKEAMNSAFRRWGLNKSRMNNWLPDLNGTNQMTARDIATILYNFDNPKFINNQSREYIRKYMSNLPTQKLIKAGLPQDAILLHKTGDIGKSLADAGIIYLPNGQKYILSIIVSRPHNDYRAREIIEEISKVVYETIKK